MKILNIHAQTEPHDESYIIGNHEGILALRDTLNAILDIEMDKKAIVNVVPATFTSDGEGFHCIIVKMNDLDFDKMCLPYTADYIMKIDGEIQPYQIIPIEELQSIIGGKNNGT